MNQQSTQARQNTASGRPVPGNAPNRVAHKKPDPGFLRTLRGAILTVGGAILLAGLLLLILPMFRISEITVEGNSYYTAEQIKEASGISVGQEILALNSAKASEQIYSSCGYVESVKIICSPFSVKIEITEFDSVMYTEFNDKYFSINRDFRVLEECESADAFADFVYVELPEIAALSVGSPLRFENESIDLSYIGDLLEELDRSNVFSSVTALDVSRKYEISYVLNDTCRVEIGKLGQTDVKMMLVEEILAKRGTAEGFCSVINVSNPQKPTYRQISSSEFLLGY